MARPDTSIDPRIMDSAREEFLALGFERASLKSICQRAGVTTGALYKRYAGKEELFRAVVADTVADLDAVYEERTAVPASALSDEDLIRAWYMAGWLCAAAHRSGGRRLRQLPARLGGENDGRHLDLLRRGQTPGLVYCGYDAGGAPCSPVRLLDHHLRALYPRLRLAGDPAPLHFGLPSL